MLASAGVLMLTLLQGIVPIVPELYWDISPLRESTPGFALSFGPADAALLAFLSTLALALALWVHQRAGGKPGALWLFLGGVGALPALMYLHWGTTSDGHLAGQWIGAVALGLAAYHLGQHEQPRRFFVACLLGLIAIWAIHALWYVLVEHPMTVKAFHQHEETFLRERGWEWGSTHHQIYQRRLSQPEVIGVFGFSNIQGSLAGALMLLAAGCTLGYALEKPRKRMILAACITSLAGLTLVLTRSRGAMLATFLAAGLLLLIVFLHRKKTWLPLLKPLRWAGLGLVALVIAVVLVRGWIGAPDSPQGERSLLFRAWYWQAAAHIMTGEQAGLHWLRGIGPAGFKDLHAAAKHPLNPEDVMSAHNVLIDLITTLGAAALAWVAMLLGWLYQAGKHATPASVSDTDSPLPAAHPPLLQVEPGVLWPVGLVTLLLLLIDVGIHLPIMMIDYSLITLGGYLGFFFLSVIFQQRAWQTARCLRWGLFAAACLLLIHNQIEMTFFQPGSVAFAWLFLGLAAAPAFTPVGTSAELGATRRDGHPSPRGFLIATACVLLVALHMGAHLLQVREHQAVLRDSAQAARQRDWPTALRILDAAGTTRPDTNILYAWMEITLAQANQPEQLPQALEQILTKLDATMQAQGPRLAYLRWRGDTLDRLGEIQASPTLHDRAIENWQRVTRLEPHSWNSRLSLAQALARAGRRAEAKRAYEETLHLSRQMYLDPMAQLPAAQKSAVEAAVRMLNN